MTTEKNPRAQGNGVLERIMDTVVSVSQTLEAVEKSVDEIRDRLLDFIDETQYRANWSKQIDDENGE